MVKQQVYKFLKVSDMAVLTKREFHIPFERVWKDTVAQRGLIVDSFHHCGIFPWKDLSKEIDFSKASVFQKMDENTAGTASAENTVRCLLTSPKKKISEKHHKPHHSLVT